MTFTLSVPDDVAVPDGVAGYVKAQVYLCASVLAYGPGGDKEFLCVISPQRLREKCLLSAADLAKHLEDDVLRQSVKDAMADMIAADLEIMEARKVLSGKKE